jgi:hypothetical protein
MQHGQQLRFKNIKYVYKHESHAASLIKSQRLFITLYILKRISLSSSWEEYIMAGLEVYASLAEPVGVSRHLQLTCIVILTKLNIT